jgi:hypothetical protein
LQQFPASLEQLCPGCAFLPCYLMRRADMCFCFCNAAQFDFISAIPNCFPSFQTYLLR